jgi:methyl-accepting chemotaxis protein
MVQKTKRHLLGFSRRRAPSKAPVEPSWTDTQDLWRSHGQLVAQARSAAEATQRVASAVSRQRGALDAATDRTRVVAGRGQELTSAVARTQDIFERLSLVALNAGLEGARLGEGPGRALLLVAEEVRGHAQRGAEAARELGASVEELGAEWLHVSSQLAAAREHSEGIAQEAARASGCCAEVERGAVELEQRLELATQRDPETMRAVGSMVEHVRALGSALAALDGRVPEDVLSAVLRPLAEPIAARVPRGRSQGP